jgi:hypothetical protein
MIVFAVIALVPNPVLDAAIAKNFPKDFLALSPTSWLIAASGTAQEVSLRLGVTTGGIGQTIVFSTAGYYGMANSNIWEWIRAKLEAPLNG